MSKATYMARKLPTNSDDDYYCKGLNEAVGVDSCA